MSFLKEGLCGIMGLFVVEWMVEDVTGAGKYGN